ncbi:hypothetical protein HDV57DRAFT_280059 [Trichoderma longibrachiatum]|uniref:Uncharacterized protein n=1 Tax=Trichoderma longibrachiatum ATCC 18648 TaxID=983965 RepID=A0A2T4CDT1_TRILO|nr:hypothetical protein M440DRAFT_245896 [Trichoderma longibrachiatum ATCC 18648]
MSEPHELCEGSSTDRLSASVFKVVAEFMFEADLIQLRVSKLRSSMLEGGSEAVSNDPCSQCVGCDCGTDAVSLRALKSRYGPARLSGSHSRRAPGAASWPAAHMCPRSIDEIWDDKNLEKASRCICVCFSLLRHTDGNGYNSPRFARVVLRI